MMSWTEKMAILINIKAGEVHHTLYLSVFAIFHNIMSLKDMLKCLKHGSFFKKTLNSHNQRFHAFFSGI